jgi:hypothetical protein
MTLSLYLNLAWQTAILTLIGYVAWRAFKKIRLLFDSANNSAAIVYSFVTFALLIPAAYIYGSAFLRAIIAIFAAL